MEPATSTPPSDLAAAQTGAAKEYLLPAEIAQLTRTDHMTVLRWLNQGITVRDAEGKRVRVRLRGRKIGGRWKVPVAALEEFVKATSGAAYPEPDPEPRETEVERKARVERCLNRLAELGMLT